MAFYIAQTYIQQGAYERRNIYITHKAFYAWLSVQHLLYLVSVWIEHAFLLVARPIIYFALSPDVSSPISLPALSTFSSAFVHLLR